MFKSKWLLLCFLSCFVLVSSTDDLSFIKPCKQDDNACLKSSAQATIPYFADGIPSLGVKKSDPLLMKEIKLNDANLNLILKNNHIEGLRNCKILNLENHVSKQTFKLVVETPINMTGQYDLHGKVLFLEALGNGDFKLQTDKIKFTVEIKYKVIEKDGHKYWRISNYDYNYDFVEKIHINFNNLFGDDNTPAAKSLKKLLDEEWEAVVSAIGGPIIDKIMNELIKIVDTFAKEAPLEKITL